MTDVIMARIEAINNGELPEGYKRTKAGIMPEDWDGAIRAKQLFKSHTDKKHNGDLEILASTQERGIVPRSQIGIDIQCSDEGVKGYKKVSKGDFVISLRSFQGGIEYSEYDGIVSPAYTILKPINDISAGFYRNYFKTDSFIDRINGAVYGIRDGKQIGYEDFGDMYVHCPPLAEQERIAEILLQCDKVIQLKQRKIKELGHQKKACLRMMFPEKGCSKPVIRFPGFSEAWEQRKLGDDLVSIHTGTNLLGSITNTGMPLIKMGNIQRGYFDTSKVEFLAENEQPDKADIANYGDFFFNTRNTLELVGKGATWMKNSGEYAFNSNIARFELRNLDTIFFNYLYNTDYMTKQIHARAMGTTSVAAIYPKTLDSVEYLAPCMKEQQKIGAYFKQLDHLITLHQRELEESKKKKKALEKLLLTGIVRVHV